LGNIAPTPDAVAGAIPARLPKRAPLDLRERDDLRDKLRVPIGVSAEGEVWRDLPSIKHARFVGMSNSGKTTMIHCALAALLMHNTPAQLRVALIDLKRNEFVFWQDAPHRWGAVARDVDESEHLLREIKTETDRRNDLLGAAQRRSIESYNASAPNPLPYLLVVIDEARDLIQQAGARSAINKLLQSVAMGGRSAGVYLWAGTQYAGAAEGLSRVISENLKSFVFRVADATSARVAGCPGAQTLPESAPGRMLARLRDDAEPTMLQGFFLDDDELRAIGARVAGQTPALPAAFSDKVRALLEWARDANSGFLAAADIQRHNADAGPRGARRLAEQLERDGLLTKDTRSQNRRRLTDHALELLGQGAPLSAAT
jgi:S-DNA-T family DNA segregation ATPase FtsK/SpoIIIE